AAGEGVGGPARVAGAAGFIEAWPAGYQTALGERATRLSPGQRQKIALARAFLRDAPILLLDEPAAHLDPVSARQIGDAVGAVPAGRTVIVITHGRGPAGSADRVICLDRGRLAPGGPPTRSGDRPLAAVPRCTRVPRAPRPAARAAAGPAAARAPAALGAGRCRRDRLRRGAARRVRVPARPRLRASGHRGHLGRGGGGPRAERRARGVPLPRTADLA